MSQHLPIIAEAWSTEQKIAYLEREVSRCDRDARSDREWPHYRTEYARCAAEIRAEIATLKRI